MKFLDPEFQSVVFWGLTDSCHFLMNCPSQKGRVRAPSRGELVAAGVVAGHLSSLSAVLS